MNHYINRTRELFSYDNHFSGNTWLNYTQEWQTFQYVFLCEEKPKYKPIITGDELSLAALRIIFGMGGGCRKKMKGKKVYKKSRVFFSNFEKFPLLEELADLLALIHFRRKNENNLLPPAPPPP